jgi:hypothetical protein
MSEFSDALSTFVNETAAFSTRCEERIKTIEDRLRLLEVVGATTVPTPVLKEETKKETLFSDKEQFAKDTERIVDRIMASSYASDPVNRLTCADLTTLVRHVLEQLCALYKGTKFCEATSRGGCNTCQLSYERQIKILRQGLTQIAGYTSPKSTSIHKLPNSIDSINAIAVGALEGSDDSKAK